MKDKKCTLNYNIILEFQLIINLVHNHIINFGNDGKQERAAWWVCLINIQYIHTSLEKHVICDALNSVQNFIKNKNFQILEAKSSFIMLYKLLTFGVNISI